VHFLFLGTSGAVPSLRRDTTSLLFVGEGETMLVDCGGSPVQKLLLAGTRPERLARVIITHIHPDHAYGLPSLVQGLFLLGRRAPLPISCHEAHADALRALLGVFGLLERPGMFPLRWEPVPQRAGVPVGVAGGFAVTASPNAHGGMPNLALRFEAGGRGAVVYSSDTEPCDDVVALARGARTLIHEATYSTASTGRVGAHSTAAEAGEVAARAGVERLLLAHMDPAQHDVTEALADEARSRFAGTVEIAEELVPYPL
jgi:ribonuclease Z